MSLMVNTKKAYVEACLLELSAIKPGNVGYHSEGHGMTAKHFEISAEVSSNVLFDNGINTIGERILAAVKVTQQAIGNNTNLGIILLIAPIVQALRLAAANTDLRSAIGQQLAQLSVADARHTYAAIRLAQAGGMGEVAAHDVNQEPTITLRQAMSISAGYDRVAYQYHTDYEDIFDHNLAIYQHYLTVWESEEWAATAVYLSQLMRQPDSLIIRKHGVLKAKQISDMIAPLAEQILVAEEPMAYGDQLLALDSDLKASAINPGTTADITVTTLFIAKISQASILGQST